MTGARRNLIAELYEVAADDESAVLERLRLRAGHVWNCERKDGSVCFTNPDDAVRCQNCGRPRPARHFPLPLNVTPERGRDDEPDEYVLADAAGVELLRSFDHALALLVAHLLQTAQTATESRTRKPVLVWTAEDAEQSAGRTLTDDELDRISIALAHSTAEQTFGDVVFAVTTHRD